MGLEIDTLPCKGHLETGQAEPTSTLMKLNPGPSIRQSQSEWLDTVLLPTSGDLADSGLPLDKSPLMPQKQGDKMWALAEES